MGKKKKEDEGKVSRRDFVKKIAYLAPAVAVLVVPKYTVAATCTGVQCDDQSTCRRRTK